MPIVEHTTTVGGPIEDVFDLSQSYALRLEWDPFVRSQRPLGGAKHAAKGVHTETVSRHHLRMVTEYLTFRRPTLVGMKMIEGPPIFENFSGSWRFAERDDGRVEVAFRYHFTCRPKFLAPLMERIGIWYLGRDIERRIESFRAACDDTDLLDHVRAARPVVSADAEPVPPIVDAAWLAERLDGNLDDGRLVICDVRSTMTGPNPEADHLAKHIPGAVLVLLDDVLAAAPAGVAGRHPLPAADDFASALGVLGIGDDDLVIAYDERGGAFASRLVWMLRTIGRRAALLDGGLDAWTGSTASGPTTRPPTVTSPVEWPDDAVADADRVVAHIERGGRVVDSRDAARYAGEVEPIDAVAGHVPGAINLPFTHNLRPDGTFRPVTELADRFTEAGVDGDAIVYCGSGVTACHNALAVEHAGLGRPSVYVGSWSGWSSDPERPVATGTP